MPPPELPPATLRLTIDREALAANWRVLDRMSGGARAGAAVKADAYGLGVAQVVPTLIAAGARDFFVAHWSEVPAVLDHVPAPGISVLHGVGSAQEAAFARATGVRPVINSLHQARIWAEAGGGVCNLMVDTGINRLGIGPADLGDPVIAALEVDTLMSHLASADEDVAANARQLGTFRELAQLREARAYSLANSAGIALGGQYAFDLTRPGLSLYGGVPRAELAGRIAQVVHPEAAVLQVRQLAAGDGVGYNSAFIAPASMRVATVSLGYADGFLRARGDKAALFFGDRALPVLGKVSMDMVVVDASQCENLREGDFLCVPFDLPETATASGLSQYELLTTLGHRFARR